MRIFILLVVFLVRSHHLNAQFQRTFFNSYELSDSIKILNVDFGADVTIESWVGSAILIETKVLIENGNNQLFEVLKKAGRYDLEEERVDSTFSIKPKFKERPTVSNQLGTIMEVVALKVLLPDSFVMADSTLWKKKEE